jgi:exopolyphosphatase/guanosine-5'-triphosphate,3'-diphosphate pyrophosphatase
MIKIKKYAAIDSSNAMPLIVNIVNKKEEPQFNKSSLACFPSGSRCFTVGEISDENLDRMCDMKAFNLLMKVHKVERYMALPPRQCASLQW